MVIEKNIQPYIIFSVDTILQALQKIGENKSRIIFAVTESGRMEGSLSDGDVRRWIIEQKDFDLNQSVAAICNTNFIFAREGESGEKISSLFSNRIDVLPVLDDENRIVGIARKRLNETGIKIGNFYVNDKAPAFIIAEIGNNHNGSLELAKKLIDEAQKSGADCAKFQLRHLDSLYKNAGNPDDAEEDLGSQYTLDLLSRFQLKNEELKAAFDYCQEKNILPLCTPWDLESLKFLEGCGMKAYKIASADLTNHDFIRELVKTGKPLILSTGMSTENEIKETVEILRSQGAMYILLHCNSTYPAPFKDINLNYLNRLKKIGDCPVGYSGHERGVNIALGAVALGAKVIEKHFTLDKNMEGIDHKVSLLPEEFFRLVKGVRELEEAQGEGESRILSQGEVLNREVLAKSLVVNRELKSGDVITAEMLDVKSPGRGLQPNRKQEVIGTTIRRFVKKGDFLYASDLELNPVMARDYKLKRPWGMPVRYHDFRQILNKTNPDLLEFHLSYKDLEEDISRYFDRSYDLDLVIHCPELFVGDHILDLCSEDAEYRQQSIQELRRVVKLTRDISKHFRNSSPTCIVTNVGGYSLDAHRPRKEIAKLYEILLESLGEINSEGVEIIPQTMPPFPWHFGGQRFHNLFMDPEDIAEFCEKNSYRICLDLSHSKLACNHFHWSFREFIEKTSPYVAHIHMVDAEGVDREGLQIGEGDIDFPDVAAILARTSPNSSFIPEIWQGHKNDGDGFWVAMERLEQWF